MTARADALPVAALLLASVLWGLSWWPLKAFGEAGVSGPVQALLTYGAIGLAGLPWLWREWARWRPQALMVLLLALVGGWGNAAFVAAIVSGEVVRVMLLFYLAPVWGVLGGWLFLGEAVTRRRALAVALALAGAFLVVGVSSAALAAPLSLADVLALSAGLGFAGNNIVSRAAQQVPTATKTVALCLGCALACGPMLAVTGTPLAWPAPALWPGLMAYAFGGLLLVTALWQWSVTRLEAGRAGVIAIAELLTAVLTAVWIGGEALSRSEWLGGALIATAALLKATDMPAEARA